MDINDNEVSPAPGRARGEKIKICEKCGIDVPSKDFTKHCQREHDKETWICPDCGKSFVGLGKLKAHQRHHETWKCDKCNQVMSVVSRSRHLKLRCKGDVEAEPKVQVHACDKCDHVSAKKSNLQRHYERKHKLSVCEDCGFQFTEISLLRSHQKRVHGYGVKVRNPILKVFPRRDKSVTSVVSTRVLG